MCVRRVTGYFRLARLKNNSTRAIKYIARDKKINRLFFFNGRSLEMKFFGVFFIHSFMKK